MKTFKDLVNEVAEPKARGEKKFKAKHEVEKVDGPNASDATHKANSVKDKTRQADYHNSEDKDVYESVNNLEEKEVTLNQQKVHFEDYRLVPVEGEELFGESFALELEDGEEIELTVEDLRKVNELAEVLDEENREIMVESIMEDEEGWDVVVEFANEVL